MSPSLKSEIKATAPFSGPEEEASLNILRTAALLEHAVAERLKPHGLTATQYNVLRILRGAGEAGLCRSDVTSRMITPVPDATRLLDRLEARGYVERRRDTDDRRFVTARITPAGLDLLDEVDGPVAELHVAQLGHMPASELEQLSALLERARTMTE